MKNFFTLVKFFHFVSLPFFVIVYDYIFYSIEIYRRKRNVI